MKFLDKIKNKIVLILRKDKNCIKLQLITQHDRWQIMRKNIIIFQLLSNIKLKIVRFIKDTNKLNQMYDSTLRL